MKPKDHSLYLQESNQRIPLFKISMVRERTYTTRKVSGVASAIEALRPIFEGADREIFAVLFLDMQTNITGMNIAHIGTLNCSIVGVREIFKAAILASAGSIIVAHNHPSGNLSPSPEDLRAHEQIKQTGEMLDIVLHDNFIFGYDSARSLMSTKTYTFSA